MTDEPIPATKDRPGTYDAIEKAEPGEAIFPILARDPFGPATVLHWVELCRRAGMSEDDPKKAQHLLRKATDAEIIAWEMRDYQRGEKPVEGKRAYYADAPLVPDAASEQAVRAALIKIASQLANAVSQGTEVFEALAKLQVHPAEEVRLREAVAEIKEVAFLIEPRRGSERS